MLQFNEQYEDLQALILICKQPSPKNFARDHKQTIAYKVSIQICSDLISAKTPIVIIIYIFLL